MTTAKSKLEKLTKAQIIEKFIESENKLSVLEKDNGDSKDFSYDDDDINIRPDRYIRVVSLCPHVLNLSTAKHGSNRKLFRFAQMGQEKRIMYQHVVDIIETHPTFTEAGFFYIMNKDVVRRHGLDDAYQEILTKKEISQVIDDDTDIALGIFNNANKRQQEYIAEILETKMSNGEHVDMNLVYHASKVTNIDIIERSENTKNYQDIDKK